jgi:ribonuclease Z
MTKKEMLLFDCGEGAQRQMMGGKVSFHKKMRIFITHLHGDHVLGLPGLLQTMALMERKEPVDVYGPVGLAAFMQSTQNTLNFCLNYPVTIHEIEGEGVVCDAEDYQILAVKSSHAIECYCLAFQEKPHPGRFNPKKASALGVPKGELWSKLQNGYNVTSKDGATVEPNMVLGPLRRGRKIVYTGDTKPFTAFAEFAKDADLVVHDCTFDESLLERAERDGHSTPRQAAEQAKAAGAKKLALTHISARYPDASALLETAKKVFPDTILAEDYLELEIELPE